MERCSETLRMIFCCCLLVKRLQLLHQEVEEPGTGSTTHEKTDEEISIMVIPGSDGGVDSNDHDRAKSLKLTPDVLMHVQLPQNDDDQKWHPNFLNCHDNHSLPFPVFPRIDVPMPGELPPLTYSVNIQD